MQTLVLLFRVVQQGKVAMRQNLLFNPSGNDTKEERRIWNGNTTNLMQLNNIKYNWAIALYKQMRENFWVAEKVDTTNDINCYKELSQGERNAYNGILSYLVFLDSLQTGNIPHLKSPITAPEINLCFGEQISQESLHSQSYQVLIDAVIPHEDKDGIYDFWRTDEVLKNRCEFVASIYQKYLDTKSDEDYFYALIADYLLEAIYFYNGFAFFFSLGSRQLMQGTADMLAYIKRDELSHVRLYQKLIPEAMETFVYSKDKILEMFNTAVEQEINWTNHITNNVVLGISDRSTEQYTKYLANLRLKAIGLDPLYSGYTENIYRHLESISDTSKEATVKANFFEATVTSYNIASAIDGWDEF